MGTPADCARARPDAQAPPLGRRADGGAPSYDSKDDRSKEDGAAACSALPFPETASPVSE